MVTALQGCDKRKMTPDKGSHRESCTLEGVSEPFPDPPAAPLPPGFPDGNPDEHELLLAWLGFLRGAVLRKIEDLSDEQARWRPDGRLISLLGIVNHLTLVEWRWIDGGMRGEPTTRPT